MNNIIDYNVIVMQIKDIMAHARLRMKSMAVI